MRCNQGSTNLHSNGCIIDLLVGGEGGWVVGKFV
jgi:hypothetical protein